MSFPSILILGLLICSLDNRKGVCTPACAHTHTWKCSAVHTEGLGGKYSAWTGGKSFLLKRWKKNGKDSKELRGSVTVWKDGSSETIGFSLKSCWHVRIQLKTDKWMGVYTQTASTLRGNSGESNLTQTISQHERRAQQFELRHTLNCNISGICTEIYYTGLGCRDIQPL